LEAIARSRDEDEQRRAGALAAGQPDPGPKPTTKLEKAADEAATKRDVLMRAYLLAGSKAIEVAEDRQDAWEQAAAVRLAKAHAEMRTMVEQLEATYGAFAASWLELAVATNP
jgi:hypothetical protein